MTIKELEERLGMTRANIRFYEQQGLLAPQRSPNGYRDYSEEDLTALERIKLLRQLQFDLDTIRALQGGELSLTDALSRQLEQLDADQATLEGSRSVCARLRDSAVSFQSLDAAPWLRELGQLPDSQHFGAPKDEFPPAPGNPWRRYIARSIDLSIYSLFVKAFREFILQIPTPVTPSGIFPMPYNALEKTFSFFSAIQDFFLPENLILTFVPLVLMFLIEPFYFIFLALPLENLSLALNCGIVMGKNYLYRMPFTVPSAFYFGEQVLGFPSLVCGDFIKAITLQKTQRTVTAGNIFTALVSRNSLPSKITNSPGSFTPFMCCSFSPFPPPPVFPFLTPSRPTDTGVRYITI